MRDATPSLYIHRNSWVDNLSSHIPGMLQLSQGVRKVLRVVPSSADTAQVYRALDAALDSLPPAAVVEVITAPRGFLVRRRAAAAAVAAATTATATYFAAVVAAAAAAADTRLLYVFLSVEGGSVGGGGGGRGGSESAELEKDGLAFGVKDRAAPGKCPVLCIQHDIAIRVAVVVVVVVVIIVVDIVVVVVILFLFLRG